MPWKAVASHSGLQPQLSNNTSCPVCLFDARHYNILRTFNTYCDFTARFRIDTGFCTGRCIQTDKIKTVGIMIEYCSYSESLYFLYSMICVLTKLVRNCRYS